MQKKLLITLTILFLLFQIANTASKFKKGGGFSSRSRDSDGLGSFGRSSRKDNDGFFKRSSTNDDGSLFKSKGFRRTNLYAGKKIQKFGDNFGKGIGAFVFSLLGISEQDPAIVSGKKAKSVNIQTSNHELTYDWLSNTIIAIAVVCCILILYWIITKKPFSQSEEDYMIRKAKGKYKETYRNYEVLQYIKENGVHPDRATGKIYEIHI